MGAGRSKVRAGEWVQGCGQAGGSRGGVRRVDPGVGSGGWIRVENQQVNPRGQAGRSRVEQVERSRLRAGKGAVSLVGPDPN